LDAAAHAAEHGPLPLPRTGSERHALLDEVERSGLLGRGGAGFPLARKIRTVAAGRRTVVVANGCEGEPASAKDVHLLSLQPHLVLDGIAVAAAGARAEAAHVAVHSGSAAIPLLRRAIDARHGTDRVRVQLHTLPPRYVASEESALVHWLNGGEAKPTFTPPRPFEKGVGGRPTLVSNVETLAHLALIARRGANWFRETGDPDEPGTLLVTVLSYEGERRVLEVPTGTRIRAVLTAAGLALQRCAAVLIGGYFGTWMSVERALDQPLTHRALRAADGSLGAGILIPLAAGRCGLTETARVVSYLAAENAGQCGPCFNGLPAVADAYSRLARGGWHERLGPALDRWLSVVPGRGACRHPDGALRLVASSFHVFAEDVAVHRTGRPCPAAGSPPVLPVPTPSAAVSQWR
jgi:NADH:ubiquinone oxidoreductase subunit F (NADH-binding)